MTQTTPFSQAELTDIRRFCGYSAYAAFGYVLGPDMATLDIQCAAMSDAEQAVVRTIYLATLYGLETAVPTAGGNLATDKAAVWTHNKSEVADRASLLDLWRLRLCEFVGAKPGPGLRIPGRLTRT